LESLTILDKQSLLLAIYQQKMLLKMTSFA